MGGNHTIEWLAYGLLDRADQLTRAGVIRPMIIVLPEGEKSYWVDHADGGPAWGAYVAEDMVAEIDSTLRTIASPCARAIGGNSMGAHGAMQLALTHPDVFSVVGAHSPTLRDHDDSLPYFGDEAYFAQHDPRTLVRTQTAAARRLRWFVDIGDKDPWLPAALDFHAELLELQIPHDFKVSPGPHDNEYWIGQQNRYLVEYSGALGTNQGGC
jgi:S-formylglutathione hydrolase FrmB